MKIYYYLFTPSGEVTKDIITARKNKYSFAIAPYTVYGGYEHMCASKLSRESENKILGSASTSSNGCYMFSTTIKEISEEMKRFAINRAEKIREIIKLEKETQEMGGILEKVLSQNSEFENTNADL